MMMIEELELVYFIFEEAGNRVQVLEPNLLRHWVNFLHPTVARHFSQQSDSS
jgi:hypothetical protein